MKLKYKQIENDSLSSIYTRRINQPYLGSHWHFHKEFELIFILKGQGMKIVGDHISNFTEGELVLVGEWLPHLWRNDPGIEGDNDVDYIVVKFSKDFNGVNIFSLPELNNIRQLLLRSHRGISFSLNRKDLIKEEILHLSTSYSSEKLIEFLKILEKLSKEDQYELLCSPGYSLPFQVLGENRLQKVINYIFDNYAVNLTLEDISEIAIMTPTAFCRFFKMRTNKTFSHFLNEVRVSKACQLLINNNISIKQICFDVGFNSLTNFNRTFRSFKGVAPTIFRKKYQILHN
jgi:AraC-like DNA-binding protein